VYGNLGRIVKNNLRYIGNLRALKAWYQHVRVLFIRDEFDRAVFDGALANLDLILNERFQRLEQLAQKVPTLEPWSSSFSTAWKNETGQVPPAAELIRELKHADLENYIAAIRTLSPGARAGATDWLQAIVDEAVTQWS
jgi:UDP-N-acetylglucosamine/UDP-N-acetylgalactosamine diphosphorylase